MKAIDNNVLIRFIAKDDDKQANLIYQLFKQTEEKMKNYLCLYW